MDMDRETTRAFASGEVAAAVPNWYEARSFFPGEEGRERLLWRGLLPWLRLGLLPKPPHWGRSLKLRGRRVGADLGRAERLVLTLRGRDVEGASSSGE
eukprot:7509903-Pyramimonas_sp.AAC.2